MIDIIELYFRNNDRYDQTHVKYSSIINSLYEEDDKTCLFFINYKISSIDIFLPLKMYLNFGLNINLLIYLINIINSLINNGLTNKSGSPNKVNTNGSSRYSQRS
eukprot:GHVR01148249.1.p1 GENE.GHVR01148249.1~~GHVR01148249.1.p1  ORF type:complete len:105 (+),score=0.27 GHVR01148249.1:593-907(+)